MNFGKKFKKGFNSFGKKADKTINGKFGKQIKKQTMTTLKQVDKAMPLAFDVADLAGTTMALTGGPMAPVGAGILAASKVGRIGYKVGHRIDDMEHAKRQAQRERAKNKREEWQREATSRPYKPAVMPKTNFDEEPMNDISHPLLRK